MFESFTFSWVVYNIMSVLLIQYLFIISLVIIIYYLSKFNDNYTFFEGRLTLSSLKNALILPYSLLLILTFVYLGDSLKWAYKPEATAIKKLFLHNAMFNIYVSLYLPASLLVTVLWVSFSANLKPIDFGFKLPANFIKPFLLSCAGIIVLIIMTVILYDINNDGIVKVEIDDSLMIAIAALSESFRKTYIALLFLFVPVVEELYFRGLLLKVFSGSLRLRYSLVLQSIFFASLHINYDNWFNVFVLGLIYGYVYIKTQSIMIPISLHLLTNYLIFSNVLG